MLATENLNGWLSKNPWSRLPQPDEDNCGVSPGVNWKASELIQNVILVVDHRAVVLSVVAELWLKGIQASAAVAGVRAAKVRGSGTEHRTFVGSLVGPKFQNSGTLLSIPLRHSILDFDPASKDEHSRIKAGRFS